MRITDHDFSNQRLDPRRRRRGVSNRDRHSATMFSAVSPLAVLLAHVGFHLRVLREQLLGR